MLTITNLRYNIYVVQYTRRSLSQGKKMSSMFIEIYVEMKGKRNYAQGVQYKVIINLIEA